MIMHFTPEQQLNQIRNLLFKLQRESRANRAEISRAIDMVDDLIKHGLNGGEPCASSQSTQ